MISKGISKGWGYPSLMTLLSFFFCGPRCCNSARGCGRGE